MASTTCSVGSKEFETLINDNEIVFVDFWAEWCAPCKNFAKVYEEAALKYDGVVFAKVNIEQEEDLAEMFQIRSIPHIMVFKEGIAIYSEAGSLPASTLSELIQQAIDADVSEIRAQLDNDSNES